MPEISNDKNDFSYLDQDAFRAIYTTTENENHSIRFYVGGIRCGKCVRRLEDLPLKLSGLNLMRVELGKNLAYAELDSTKLSIRDLAEAIREMGFSPIPLPSDQDEEKALKDEDKIELIRLGVAAACAGNIMMFSFANYLGDTGPFKDIFEWLAFLLYLPVVSFVAWPFYKGAVSSLKEKILSIDLPMAVASLSGFIFSTVELLRGRDDIYFDSLSGFLFLILLSRWIQKRLQRKYLKPDEMTESLQLQKVRRKDSEGWTWLPLGSLKVGDEIVMHESETLPADATLVSTRSRFSLAWLSGEVKSKVFLKDAVVLAGARLSDSESILKVTKLFAETSFGNIINQVQKYALSKNRSISMADRWAQWLLIAVFFVAINFLIFYSIVSPEEAIRRSLALIILACPCAMAFGTPLAMASALKRASQKGLVVRNANVFENATKIKTIFFDKTGTLTETELSLVQHPETIRYNYQKIILALENSSEHPIAFAFRKAFVINEPLPTVEDLTEVAGEGVSGKINGKHYQIKSYNQANLLPGCGLFENHILIYNFSFAADLKPDCKETINSLRKSGYKLILLSGDQEQVVESIGQSLGFTKDEVFYGMLPNEKYNKVLETDNAMMVGDGINDSLALMRAQVGVATSGGVESALRSSDVFLTANSLKPIEDLLIIGKDTMALIRQNLTISLVYNLIGASLALLGYINPFTAALLMPASSGFILFSTWLRGRTQ